MGPRTEAARDLGELLTLPADRPRERAPKEDLQRLADEVATWKGKAYRGHLLEAPTPGERVFEAVSDLQRDIIGNAIALRQDGLTPGKP